MDGWVSLVVILIAAIIIIGNLSTFQKSSKTPLRKKGLNDLKETLPRTNKSKAPLSSFQVKDKNEEND